MCGVKAWLFGGEVHSQSITFLIIAVIELRMKSSYWLFKKSKLLQVLTYVFFFFFALSQCSIALSQSTFTFYSFINSVCYRLDAQSFSSHYSTVTFTLFGVAITGLLVSKAKGNRASGTRCFNTHTWIEYETRREDLRGCLKPFELEY